MASELDRLMQRVVLGVAVLTLAGMGYGEWSYGGPTGDVPDAGELVGWPVLPPYEDHIQDTVYAPGGGIYKGPATTNSHDFPVEQYATGAIIELQGDGSGDLDLAIYGTEGQECGSSGNAGDQEKVTMTYRDFAACGTGDYTAEVTNWGSAPNSYDLFITVLYEGSTAAG